MLGEEIGDKYWGSFINAIQMAVPTLRVSAHATEIHQTTSGASTDDVSLELEPGQMYENWMWLDGAEVNEAENFRGFWDFALEKEIISADIVLNGDSSTLDEVYKYVCKLAEESPDNKFVSQFARGNCNENEFKVQFNNIDFDSWAEGLVSIRQNVAMSLKMTITALVIIRDAADIIGSILGANFSVELNPSTNMVDDRYDIEDYFSYAFIDDENFEVITYNE